MVSCNSGISDFVVACNRGNSVVAATLSNSSQGNLCCVLVRCLRQWRILQPVMMEGEVSLQIIMNKGRLQFDYFN